jgi:hypothetical protein
MKLLLIALFAASIGAAQPKIKAKCRWEPQNNVGRDREDGPWLEYRICGDEIVGAARNKQNSTGDSSDSRWWLAERPLGWVIGTYTNKAAAKRKIEASR